MAKFKINETDIETVSRERYEHPSPMVQKRMTALYLKHIGLKHDQVAQGAQCSIASVTNWIAQYKKEGLEGLRNVSGRVPYSKLRAHKDTLENYFKNYPVATVKEAQEKIAELTGVQRGKTQIRMFLKSLGLSYRKTGAVPGKADPKKQEEFKKKSRAKVGGST